MIVKSIILAVSKNGNFVILGVMIGKRNLWNCFDFTGNEKWKRRFT